MLPRLTRILRNTGLGGHGLAAVAAAALFCALPAHAQENGEEPATEAPASETPAPEAPAGDLPVPTTPSPEAGEDAAGTTQGAVRSTHGAWSIVCDQPAGAPEEQCALMQNVIAEDRPEVGLSVVVLKTADEEARILRVLAPLGVLLPNGLGLNIDGEDIGRAYFVRCFTDGCYAEVILEDELLQTLREGTTANFIVFQTPEEGIGIPVDLEGFGEGFDALP